MENYIPTAWVLLINNNNVLLVKHLDKAWHINWVHGIPAWRFEEWETEEDCAIRELKEETNLDILKTDLTKTSKTYYASIKRKSWETKKYSMVVFRAKNFSWMIKSNDETEPIWVDLEKLDYIDLLPSVKEIINDNIDYFNK